MLTEIAATFTMWASISVVLIAIILYMSERFPMELVSAGIITVLLLLFSLPFAIDQDGAEVRSDQILAGFGNGALITIMCLLVIGQALFQTGALDGPSRRLLKSYERHPRWTLIGIYAVVFLISAFINNTPVVVMFMPMIGTIAARAGIAPSRLLIPLSFISVLAGMTTLIGSSTNLLAAEALSRTVEGASLGFFQQTPIGLMLASVGLLYIAVFAPLILPEREGEGSEQSLSGKQFIAQIEVNHGHPMLGKSAVAGMFQELPNMTVRMIQRGDETFLPPFEDIVLEPHDLIILASTRKALTEALGRRPRLLRSIWLANFDTASEETSRQPNLSLSEAVVAPGSRLISRTIDQIGFARANDIVVLGVQRRSRMIRARLGEIRLEAGDTLLLCGTPEAKDTMRSDRDLLLLDWSRTDLPDPAKAVFARIVTAGVVVAAATSFLDILVASMLGAVAMIALGCINVRQAVRALDIRIFMLIGAALAMGASLEATGAADFLARQGGQRSHALWTGCDCLHAIPDCGVYHKHTVQFSDCDHLHTHRDCHRQSNGTGPDILRVDSDLRGQLCVCDTNCLSNEPFGDGTGAL